MLHHADLFFLKVATDLVKATTDASSPACQYSADCYPWAVEMCKNSKDSGLLLKTYCLQGRCYVLCPPVLPSSTRSSETPAMTMTRTWTGHLTTITITWTGKLPTTISRVPGTRTTPRRFPSYTPPAKIPPKTPKIPKPTPTGSATTMHLSETKGPGGE